MDCPDARATALCHVCPAAGFGRRPLPPRLSPTPRVSISQAWVYRGELNDPYGEFMVHESPQHLKEGLTKDFNCQYWGRRFTLLEEQARRLARCAVGVG